MSDSVLSTSPLATFSGSMARFLVSCGLAGELSGVGCGRVGVSSSGVEGFRLDAFDEHWIVECPQRGAIFVAHFMFKKLICFFRDNRSVSDISQSVGSLFSAVSRYRCAVGT